MAVEMIFQANTIFLKKMLLVEMIIKSCMEKYYVNQENHVHTVKMQIAIM